MPDHPVATRPLADVNAALGELGPARWSAGLGLTDTGSVMERDHWIATANLNEAMTWMPPDLRALQAPIKDRYKSRPQGCSHHPEGEGHARRSNIACKVETGRALAVAGLHPATGGSGLELCSGDMLLEALVACAGVTLKAVATALDIPLKAGMVSAEGDLDFRGTLGVAKDAPVGFAQIRLALRRRNRRAAGQARSAAQADRALLRGLSDHQKRPAGRGEACGAR